MNAVRTIVFVAALVAVYAAASTYGVSAGTQQPGYGISSLVSK